MRVLSMFVFSFFLENKTIGVNLQFTKKILFSFEIFTNVPHL